MVLALSACDSPPSSEQLFRQTLSDMETSIQQGDVSAFLEFIDESYTDSRGRTREDIRRIAQLHVLRNRNLHLYHHVTRLEFVEDESADVNVLVALAGQPVASPASLANIRAELMQFDVQFDFDQQWKVVSASWSRAGIDDFLSLE